MKNVKLLVLDVDGTLTDGKIYLGPLEESMKAFNVKDGLGISKLHENEIIPVIITGRNSDIVSIRAKELNITEVYQGVHDKLSCMKNVSQKYQCTFDEIAYIGDDENDLECIVLCGLTGCPADAVNKVQTEVDFISEYKGGEGAVRDFIEYILD